MLNHRALPAGIRTLTHLVGLLTIGLLALNGLLGLGGGAVGAAPNAQSPSAAQPIFNFQGVVRDAEGKPLPNGDYTITFRIYPELTGGSPIWAEEQSGVTVRDGRFSASLGGEEAIPASLFAGAARFIGVQVQGYEEMQPRQRIASVPYALNAESLGGRAPSSFAPAQHSHDAAAITSGELPDARIANTLTVSGGAINNTPIGQATPAQGSFTSLQARSLNLGNFTVDAGGVTSTSAINIKPTSGGNTLLINDRKPFMVKLFSGLGDNALRDTGISSAAYYCGVSGFGAAGGDILESDTDGNLIRVYTYSVPNGNWQLAADFRTHNKGENWSVVVLCIDWSLVSQ